LCIVWNPPDLARAADINPILRDVSFNERQAWVQRECTEHPQETIKDAAERLYLELMIPSRQTRTGSLLPAQLGPSPAGSSASARDHAATPGLRDATSSETLRVTDDALHTSESARSTSISLTGTVPDRLLAIRYVFLTDATGDRQALDVVAKQLRRWHR